VQEPALAPAEQRVHPILHEGAEAQLEMDLGQHRVLGLLQAVEEVLADAVRLEHGGSEVALLHPGRGEEDQPVHAHRGGGGEDPAEGLGAGKSEHQVEPGAWRRRLIEGEAEHGLGLGEGKDLCGAGAAAEHAGSQRASRTGAEHVAQVMEPRTAHPGRPVRADFLGLEQQEVHRSGESRAAAGDVARAISAQPCDPRTSRPLAWV
jgi:hypothetical protein